MNELKFCKHINKLRLTYLPYTFDGIIDGKTVKIEGYGTWLRVFTVDGIQYGAVRGASIAKFKQYLSDTLYAGEIK